MIRFLPFGQFEDVPGLALSYYLMVLQEYFTWWYCCYYPMVLRDYLSDALKNSCRICKCNPAFFKICSFCSLPSLLPVRKFCAAADAFAAPTFTKSLSVFEVYLYAFVKCFR